MRAYKEHKYLVFDFEDGTNVKYDLSTGEAIGKRGQPVLSLSNQLAGYSIDTIIKSFEDEKYQQFLQFVYRNKRGHYTNLGTFLGKVESMLRFEQFFAAGVTSVSKHLTYKLASIPKGLIQLSQQHEWFVLTNDVVNEYNKHGDIIRNLLNTEFESIEKEWIYSYLLSRPYYSESFVRLIQVHKYNYQTLMHYVDNLITYEALDNLGNVLREICDYANMMCVLSPKFEKYPRYFLSTHKIAARNYNRLKLNFPEELFQKVRQENFECTIGEYVFIYPATIQEIKDEAVQQQNCLTSYIQKVLNNECHIMFMRDEDDPVASLVTLEIKGNRVVQAKGKYNRSTTNTEQSAINKFNERLAKTW